MITSSDLFLIHKLVPEHCQKFATFLCNNFFFILQSLYHCFFVIISVAYSFRIITRKKYVLCIAVLCIPVYYNLYKCMYFCSFTVHVSYVIKHCYLVFTHHYYCLKKEGNCKAEVPFYFMNTEVWC